MTKIVSTKTTSAIFLAIVPVIGTIVAVNSLFMVGAQAEPYDGIHNDRKDDTISSLNCNNINVNVNGLELDILPPSLSTLITGGEADATAYSYASGNGNYDSESSNTDNDFRVICINNNNNTIIEEETPIPPTPPLPQTCEECFEQKLNTTSLNNFLGFLSGVGFSLTDFCNALADQEGEGAIELAVTLNLKVVSISDSEIQAVIQCLKDIGFIPPPST
jgi:hypothetical protein